MASSPRRLFAAALCLAAARAQAQTPAPFVLGGRVVRAMGADSVPVRGVVVVGHHVDLERQGPVDSVRTDAAGRFRLVLPRPDTSGMYVVSTQHQGIGYFASPVQAGDHEAAAALLLVVYDTSVAGPPLTLAMRHVVVTAAERDGARRVMDILQVHNGGATTRVGRDTSDATWSVRLPAGVVDFAPGEGEVSPTAVRIAGGTVLVTAPFPPGDKQVVVTYVIPRGADSLSVVADQPTERLELLIEDAGAAATGAGVQPGEPVTLQGRAFRRFSADTVATGATLVLRFSAAGDLAGRFAWVAVVAAVVALAAGVGFAHRRRGARAAADGAAESSNPDDLAAAIAALDARYEAGEAATPPGEWARYRERRAEIMARLEAELARGATS